MIGFVSAGGRQERVPHALRRLAFAFWGGSFGFVWEPMWCGGGFLSASAGLMASSSLRMVRKDEV